MSETGGSSVLRRRALLCDLGLRAVLVAGLVLAGIPATHCTAEQAPPSAQTGSVAVSEPVPQAIARQVVADALGIFPDGTVVVSSEARDFPDGSLDCPQPGMAYAQVITPGYRVLVEAAGRRFDVRVAGTGGRICYRRKATSAADRSARAEPRLRAAAREDLALRLHLPSAEVTVTGQRALNPGDALPGCGVVCATDAAPGECGTSVRLRAGDRDYDYVARSGEVRPCPDLASR